MRELTHEELREVQLEILHQFDEYCLKNGLCYMLCAGTLLGAVRHKGFIPWDDDIDVMMPRPDYERLRTLCEQQPIGEHLSLRTPQSTPHFNAPFAKLIDTRTDGHEQYLRKDIRNGVWIDIFPLDGLPEDLEKREALLQKMDKQHHRLKLSCRPCDFTWNPLKLAKRVALYCLYHHVDYRKLACEMDEAAQAYAYEDCETVCTVSFDARPHIYEKRWLEKAVRLPFEKYTCNAPADYDAVLRANYGDYMTPPPKEQQISHHLYTAYWVEE